MKQSHPNVILAGAAPDTGNHGVTALCQSAVFGLADRGVQQFTILDHGEGARHGGLEDWSSNADITRLGFRGGKRVYQASNMYQVRLRQMFGLPSPILDAFKAADAVLDVSGGDSFTDLYGPKRFEQIVLPKLIALDCGTPLVLLPQTYGPYRSRKTRALARHIVANSALAYARDINSFNNMKALLGQDFDPEHHRLGVDLAFGLPKDPQAEPPVNRPIGLNVSGLLWNSLGAKSQFSLAANYKETLHKFCLMILERTNKSLLLVPHVTPTGGESDLVACRALMAQIPNHLQGRISIEETAIAPSALKTVISGCSWFSGARMHATIAALSTITPVANMAYSRKASGVFEACGAGNEVFDLRTLSTAEMVASLWRAFERRHQQEQILRSHLPFAKRRWSYQMDAISGAVKGFALQGEAAHA